MGIKRKEAKSIVSRLSNLGKECKVRNFEETWDEVKTRELLYLGKLGIKKLDLDRSSRFGMDHTVYSLILLIYKHEFTEPWCYE